MPTPRKRWFKVADAILREPWPREEKLALVLLMAHLNTRWARDGVADSEAGNTLLSKGAVRDIAGLRGVRVLSSLSQRVSFSVSEEGEFVRIDWPKFSIFQEYGSRDRARRKTPPTPSPSPSPREEKRRKRTVAAGSRGEPKPGQQAVAIFCEEFGAARELKPPPVPGRSAKELREQFEAMDCDAERLRAAVKAFFRLEDPWIKDASYSLGAFLGVITKCDVRGQNAIRLAPLRVPQEPIEPIECEAKLASIFGAGKGKLGG